MCQVIRSANVMVWHSDVICSVLFVKWRSQQIEGSHASLKLLSLWNRSLSLSRRHCVCLCDARAHSFCYKCFSFAFRIHDRYCSHLVGHSTLVVVDHLRVTKRTIRFNSLIFLFSLDEEKKKLNDFFYLRFLFSLNLNTLVKFGLIQ